MEPRKILDIDISLFLRTGGEAETPADVNKRAGEISETKRLELNGRLEKETTAFIEEKIKAYAREYASSAAHEQVLRARLQDAGHTQWETIRKHYDFQLVNGIHPRSVREGEEENLYIQFLEQVKISIASHMRTMAATFVPLDTTRTNRTLFVAHQFYANHLREYAHAPNPQAVADGWVAACSAEQARILLRRFPQLEDVVQYLERAGEEALLACDPQLEYAEKAAAVLRSIRAAASTIVKGLGKEPQTNKSR